MHCVLTGDKNRPGRLKVGVTIRQVGQSISIHMLKQPTEAVSAEHDPAVLCM